MKRLQRGAILALVTLLLFAQPSFSTEQVDPTALVAAENFLQLLDNDEYQLAWSQTSIVNQGYIGYPRWFDKILAVRPHLGQVITRSLAKTSRHTSWVGLPDGNYLRFSFNTSYSNKLNTLDTILLSREGTFWSISSYYLR